MTKLDIKQILDSIQEMPSMPNIVHQVLDISNDPTKGVKELLQVIQYDQAITANCLRMCNTAFFGTKQRVSSIKDALVMLGSKKVAQLVLAGSTSQYFKSPQEGYGLRKGELWEHSVATAIISQLICHQLNIRHDPTLFTACLIHDIGKVVLNEYVGSKRDEIKRYMDEEQLKEHEAEFCVLGVDHAKAGAYLAKRWNFPGVLIRAIQYHHNANYDSTNQLNFLVRVSNVLANMHSTSYSGSFDLETAKLLQSISLKIDDISKINDRFPERMEQVKDIINL